MKPGSPTPPLADINALAADILTMRPSRYRKSRLDRFEAEIRALTEHGLRPADIQRWLARDHKLKVQLSTITRWLDKNEVRPR